MTSRPLVQLYCKRLTPANLDAFLAAEPDHVGWQINMAKTTGHALELAIANGAQLVRRLTSAGVKSVFLLHPSADHNLMRTVLGAIRPDIFLASAERSAAALAALKREGVVGEVMIPIGVPVVPDQFPSYDPAAAMTDAAGVADWYTTDTIAAGDSPLRFGCSGRTSDWDAMSALVRDAPRPVVAAGGLTPDNVAALWRLCQPQGFDAHTSVCIDGLPDRDRSIAFTRAVRALA